MSNQAGLGIGDRVHTEEINEYPEDLKQEYLQLSTWLKAVAAHYGRSVVIRLIDPQSLVGMGWLLRYRVRRYPTFILNREEKFVGWEAEAAFHTRLRERLAAAGLPVPPEPFRPVPEIHIPR